ncbi:3'-5' exonuclease [Paenibacillus larvae]|uniref:3'-5' exonuclease n=1 Tax=Paenibacillus larvae TaxID=1464 RepID=UPI00288F15E7|nr:3'-5' exonuclease [Paenibacillus larvae]MDT2192201.1 3'-5' exonuclease [Paenibacillus larvae]MDT2239497.1 3'-5' exonuclease [Paenibacillus larvae]MDT2246140.1 3'-5' exonuclease [Paenibacillus larvae]
MTIHRSKGLEFPVVYLIGVSERVLPHSTSLKRKAVKTTGLRENMERRLPLKKKDGWLMWR